MLWNRFGRLVGRRKNRTHSVGKTQKRYGVIYFGVQGHTESTILEYQCVGWPKIFVEVSDTGITFSRGGMEYSIMGSLYLMCTGAS